MCIAPNRLPDGTEVGCRECWQCKEHKVMDWVGRCIAESKTALRTFSITLTYGRDEKDRADHVRSALLTYSDVQEYFKRLRHSGYVVRYFAVGEYGSKNGRSHWHLIVFYYDNSGVISDRKQLNTLIEAANARILDPKKRRKLWPIPDGPVPEHEISTRGFDGDIRDVRFTQQHWRWGWSTWEELQSGYDEAAARAVRYVCKYLLKDSRDDAAQMLGPRLSKKPPLGDAYFRWLATDYVRQGLAPQDLFYRFDGVTAKDGSLGRFQLGGVSADNFLGYYCEALVGRPLPVNMQTNDSALSPFGRRARLQYEVDLAQWVLDVVGHERRPNSILVEEWLDALIAPLNDGRRIRDRVAKIKREQREKYARAYGPGFNLWARADDDGEA